MRFWFLVFALSCAAVTVVSCNAKPACSYTNCMGCCDSSGTCQMGNTLFACGTRGGACSVCTGSQLCTQSSCVGDPDGGPIALSCAQSCDGCCSSGTCVVGTAATACGFGGENCRVCNGSQQCTSGECRAAGCGGCFNDAGTCANGNVDSACGSQGRFCSTCSGSDTCQNVTGQQICTGGSCGGCRAGGVCFAGDTKGRCGSGGNACQLCTGNSYCAMGQCQDAGVRDSGQVDAGPLGETCSDVRPLDFVSGVATATGSTVGYADDYQSATLGCDTLGGDRYFSFTTTGVKNLSAVLKSKDVAYEPTLVLLQGCPTSVELGCHTALADTAVVTQTALPAGTYYLDVDAKNGAGPFELTVTLQ